jgi:hypothetical protein
MGCAVFFLLFLRFFTLPRCQRHLISHLLMNQIFNSWSDFYFTEPFLVVCILFSVRISNKYRKKENTHSLLSLYMAMNLFLFLPIEFLSKIYPKSLFNSILWIETINILFQIIELYIFISYFKILFSNKKYDYVSKTLFIIYLFISTTYLIWIFYNQTPKYYIRKFSFLINSLELSILLGCTLYYYYRIFKSTPEMKLNSSPSFWIASGLFFYCITAIPFFCIAEVVKVIQNNLYNMLIATHYITLALLFLSITRAYLCKKQLTI